jgi:hypothetical protein
MSLAFAYVLLLLHDSGSAGSVVDREALAALGILNHYDHAVDAPRLLNDSTRLALE